MLRIKPIYEPALPEDGKRIYIDRLWPGGMKKSEEHNNATAMKEILGR